MATVFWNGNAQFTAQVVTITITAVATGGVVTCTINGKSVSYTMLSTDTTATTATALQAALAASTAPTEFGEITWSASGSTVTGTANAAGTPFASANWGLTTTFTAGATGTQATTTANSSPSDVNNAQNWVRLGVQALPQSGDDMIVSNSTVPLLWNLDQLANVRLNSFDRWLDFTATIGLPENNPLGYYEYRPTYFQFLGPTGGVLLLTLGFRGIGSGPTRERYNVGAQQTNLIVRSSGSPTDEYAVRFLGTSPLNTVKITGTSVGIGMLAGETASLITGTVDGGGTLDCGAGVTFSGVLTVTSGFSTLNTPPAQVVAFSGSQIVVTAKSAQAVSSSSGSPGSSSASLNPLLFPSVTLRDQSTCAWYSDSNLTTLIASNGSIFDKSTDVNPITITNSTLDANCQVLDPNNTITWKNPTTIIGGIGAGVFVTGPGRTVQVV